MIQLVELILLKNNIDETKLRVTNKSDINNLVNITQQIINQSGPLQEQLELLKPLKCDMVEWKN